VRHQAGYCHQVQGSKSAVGLSMLTAERLVTHKPAEGDTLRVSETVNFETPCLIATLDTLATLGCAGMAHERKNLLSVGKARYKCCLSADSVNSVSSVPPASKKVNQGPGSAQQYIRDSWHPH
jgi:hypothetical protein